MSSGFDAMINSMLGELDKQREEMTRLQAAIASVTATAIAPKRQVSVTVDARGEVTDLKFLNQSYRTMSPAELSTLIVATIRDAQQQVRVALAEQTGGIGPTGATPADLAAGSADWHTAFGEIFSMPESLVEALSKRPTDLLDGVDTEDPQPVLDELRDVRQRRKDAQ